MNFLNTIKRCKKLVTERLIWSRSKSLKLRGRELEFFNECGSSLLPHFDDSTLFSQLGGVRNETCGLRLCFFQSFGHFVAALAHSFKMSNVKKCEIIHLELLP